jgi:hypothetical protein
MLLSALPLLIPAVARAGRVRPHDAAGARVTITQTSADLLQRLTPVGSARFSVHGERRGAPTITVNDRIHYQPFIGMGAAMTDSSAWR